VLVETTKVSIKRRMCVTAARPCSAFPSIKKENARASTLCRTPSSRLPQYGSFGDGSAPFKGAERASFMRRTASAAWGCFIFSRMSAMSQARRNRRGCSAGGTGMPWRRLGWFSWRMGAPLKF
jgi:hypothetical protein